MEAVSKQDMSKKQNKIISDQSGGNDPQRGLASDFEVRADAARELEQSARTLKAAADQNGLRMVAYLLNLVELEAADCQKSLSARAHATGGKKA